MMAIALLLIPALGFAQEEAGSEELATAIRHYRSGELELARTTLIALLNDEGVEDRELLVQARVYLGEVLFVLDRPEEAVAAFRAILEHEPDYRLDPYEHPPDVVDFYETLRGAIRDLGFDEDQQPEPEPLPSPQSLPPLALAPFGIHQFRQRHIAKGLLLSSGEAALMTGSLVTAIKLYGDHDADSEADEQALTDRRLANRIMAGGFYGLWLVGIIDAAVSWRREQRAYPVEARLRIHGSPGSMGCSLEF